MANSVSTEIEDDQKGDILIEYGGIEYKRTREKTLTYNVSNFLRNYKMSFGPNNKKIKMFINTLDRRVLVDTTVDKYKPLMDSLNTIIDNICTKIANADKRCSKITKLLTGSIKAGVKVDLPFEVDFLLALPHMSYKGFQQLSVITFKTFMDKAIKEPDILCHGWSITNVKLHREGITLAMAYDQGDRYTQPMGVLVDIVPVYFHENNEDASADWSENAMRCIQD